MAQDLRLPATHKCHPLSSQQISTGHHHSSQPTPPGGLGTAAVESPTVPAPVSQHSMPRRKSPSVALGAQPSTRVDDPLSLQGNDLATPDPMATYSWESLGEAMPEHVPNIIQVSHSPSLPTVSKTLDMASMSPIPVSIPPGLVQPACLMRCFACKGDECSPQAPAHDQGHLELMLGRTGPEC